MHDVDRNASSHPEAIAKTTMRKAVLRIRSSLPKEERALKSERICAQLVRAYDIAASERGGTLTACVYSAFGSEVDVGAFARHVWAQKGRVAFPCMEVRTPTPATFLADAKGCGPDDPPVDEREARAVMRMRVVSREAFEAAQAGEDSAAPFLRSVTRVFDPCDVALHGCPVVDPAEIDIAIIPLVAFDEVGGRLGYGGGNYDEFLGKLRPDALVVGVGFAEQRVERVPREPHDLSLPLFVSA